MVGHAPKSSDILRGMKHLLAAATATAALLATPIPAQINPIVIGGVQTNATFDWSQVIAVPDATMPDTFLALMPLSAVSSWASWEGQFVMDTVFGSGNWSRLQMNAVSWAYLSPDPCAHQPGPGTGMPTPASLLTTDYDYGPYNPVYGYSLFQDATAFQGSNESFVAGLTGTNAFIQERWQLRTRAFFGTAWNGCTPSLTPSFSGFLLARFSYQIL